MFNNPNISPEVLLGLGSALTGGRTSQEQLGNIGTTLTPILAAQRQQQQQTEEKNRTLAYLRNTNPQLAAQVEAGLPMNAAWAQLLESQKPKKPNLMSVGGALYNPDTGQWITPPNAGQVKPTDDMREYELAKQQGFQGSFLDFQMQVRGASRPQVNIGTGGEKLPGGYRWLDPNNPSAGVEPIPGGPATQIPAELAARVGMADNFLSELPKIKESVKNGDVTGWLDVGRAKNVGGNETYSKIESGVDALQRMLTGAGMNVAEAEAYSRRYLPSYFDDDAAVNAKLDRLAKELTAAKEKAMRGRGSEEDGVIDAKDYFKVP